MAAWVRLDRLNAPFQSILHTDGWSANGWEEDGSKWGQVHWTVTNRQTMELAMAGNELLSDGSEQTLMVAAENARSVYRLDDPGNV